MAAPATVDEFIDLVRKSGVVEEGRLTGLLEALSSGSAMPVGTNELAARLIRDGLLTQFQARQILAGKWRRFMIGGKYKLMELLGAGGMGAVYLCEHIFMRRLVALKVLPTDKITDPSMVERFYREARASAALDHPNIVRAYDIDQFDSLHFLVMEYIEGSSLHEIVARHGPMDSLRAAHYTAQAAAGLQYAHEKGLVHRDIKPGNLLLDRAGTVKILDLGLARFFGNKSDSVTEKYDERTVLGTADYLAPEQAVQNKVDIRADIYALGCTLFFLLTGRPPFPDGTVAQKLIWHQMKEPPTVTALRPDVPPLLASVLKRMLAKKADERFQEPYDVVTALAPMTAVAIGPPSDAEMPRLSPAVVAANANVGATARPLSGSAMVAALSRPMSRPGSSGGSRSAAHLPTPAPAEEGPPDTMAMPRPGSEEEKALLKSAGLKSGDPEQVETPNAAGNRVLLLLAGVVLGAVVLGGGGIFAYLWWQIYSAGQPISLGPKTPPMTPLPAPPLDRPTPLEEARRYAEHSQKALADGKQKFDYKLMVEYEVGSVGSAKGSGLSFFLNSDKDWRKPGNFVTVIPPDVTERLRVEQKTDPKTLYEGKRVRVTGVVKMYAKPGEAPKPEIEITDPEQIRIVGEPGE